MSDARTAILDSAKRLRPTLGTPEWIYRNRSKMSLALPASWVPASDRSFLLRFGFALKIAGVEWTEQVDLTIALQWLSNINIAESLGHPGSHGATVPWLIRRATSGPTL